MNLQKINIKNYYQYKLNNLFKNNIEIKNIKFSNFLLHDINNNSNFLNYKLPNLNLIKQIDDKQIIIMSNKELENNKIKIVKILNNYGIQIAHITATIGPTVTLYEIIPKIGIRVAKIKNLENDIALSLSAIAIRIIAPIPGKGTIGIEVPNIKKSIVSMYSVLSSSKLIKTNKIELPIILGKTISNETFFEDLTEMPHLLLAGATGQGKSIGLNIIITSLLYQKHPKELKFILIDPKKVEFNIYHQIENFFLAKIPNNKTTIISDKNDVINTLNSLCVEMDKRYNLLNHANVKNIKEYNQKLIKKKLNYNNNYVFLPYIVVIIDEFADLIITDKKQIEIPITRLAQLARATGIHLIIATQRPSVNIITGTIKANFPARIAFKVSSKIDSRTILDKIGAEKLNGKGDMLFTKGNDIIRLQCAFINTNQINTIVNFIKKQKTCSNIYTLPQINIKKEKNK